MNNAELYKVICEKIDINQAFTAQALLRIETQTTKTNGRVSSLEVKIWELEKDEVTHILNCPNVPKIEALEKENLEIRVIKKYPKLALGVLVVSVAAMLVSIWLGYNKLGNELNTIQARQQMILNSEQSLMKK